MGQRGGMTEDKRAGVAQVFRDKVSPVGGAWVLLGHLGGSVCVPSDGIFLSMTHGLCWCDPLRVFLLGSPLIH